MYPAECGEQLGRVPSKIGSSKPLVLKSFFSGEGTLWDPSLPVSLSVTLWGTPALSTPPLPLPQSRFRGNSQSRSKVGPTVGFRLFLYRETLLPDLLLTYF